MTTTEPSQLAAALAAFHAELPRIGKDNTAQVRSDKGSYSYKYADLSDVSGKVLPLLAKHGLSFSAKPTLTDDGRFVLEYTLRHTSGESDTGRYPLPTNGTPQQIGSAITYARRYTLSAVTGIVPDEDDDGHAAEHYARSPQRAQREPDRDRGVYDQAPDPADAARSELLAAVQERQLDMISVRKTFARQYGQPVASAGAEELRAFTAAVRADPGHVLALANGQPVGATS